MAYTISGTNFEEVDDDKNPIFPLHVLTFSGAFVSSGLSLERIGLIIYLCQILIELFRLSHFKEMNGQDVFEYKSTFSTAEDTLLKACRDALKAFMSNPNDRRKIQAVLRKLYLQLDPRSVVAENEKNLSLLKDKGADYSFSPPSLPVRTDAASSASSAAPARHPGGPVFSRPPALEPVFSRPSPESAFSPLPPQDSPAEEWTDSDSSEEEGDSEDDMYN